MQWEYGCRCSTDPQGVMHFCGAYRNIKHTLTLWNSSKHVDSSFLTNTSVVIVKYSHSSFLKDYYTYLIQSLMLFNLFEKFSSNSSNIHCLSCFKCWISGCKYTAPIRANGSYIFAVRENMYFEVCSHLLISNCAAFSPLDNIKVHSNWCKTIQVLHKHFYKT